MNTKDAIRQNIDFAQMVASGYLQDLTDEEMMRRPCPQSNHIKWQVGHLISAEHNLIDKAAPGCMPPLPEGFADRYAKEKSSVDDPAAFDSKDNLLAAAETQRAGTLAALEKIDEGEFDKETGIEYAPTIGHLFSLQGSHWMMHAGQWAVIRRQLGREPLF
jgi:DinB superfamily